ncbi:MAG: hypothetical protein NTY76_00410 [Candidatus Omnitrophica bacterium]|nr:hypothetical protein [Candidatus Omnitrophota bacterium]
MKKWIFAVVWILAILLILGMAKDLVIKFAVESGARIVTGLNLKIGVFRVGIFNTLVDIRNLRILNPAGFKDKMMLDMPEIYVKYDLPAIFKGKIYLKEVRINMKEFVVVKNEKGELNLNSLRVVKAQKSGSSPKVQAGGKAPEIQIDKLRLKAGKVIYKDYSSGGVPRIIEYNINIDEEYRDITDPYTLVSLIVARSLMNTSIANLTNFDLNGLSSSVSGVLANAQQVTDTAKAATEAVKNVQGTASKAASAVSDVLGDVFGSKK